MTPISSQTIFVVGEHAAVQQDPATTGKGEEGEPMKVTEGSEVNKSAHRSVGTDPRKNLPLGGSYGYTGDAPKEMPVPDKDIESATPRQFHLKRVIKSSVKEARPNLNSLLAKPLFYGGIEKSIEVCLFVDETNVGMVSRHTVDRQLRNACQWDKEIVKEETSTFIDLLKPDQFQFVGLLWIDRFAVHDVTEKQNVDFVWLVDLDDFVKFFCDSG